MATISPAEAALPTSASHTPYRAREAEAGSPSKSLLSGPSETTAMLNNKLRPLRHRHHHTILPSHRLGSRHVRRHLGLRRRQQRLDHRIHRSRQRQRDAGRHAHPKLRPAPQDQHPIARRVIVACRDRRAQPRHLQLDRSTQGTTPQLGFIAQQVQPIFPNLVSTTSPTALTPNGTLSLNYIGLISPIVSAIQALSAELSSIENTIAGFAQSFTTQVLTAATDHPAATSQRTLRRFDLRHARTVPSNGRSGQPSSGLERPRRHRATAPPHHPLLILLQRLRSCR